MDPTSFDDFYLRTSPGLLRQIHALTGNYDEAQDCVHDAYIKLWQRWSDTAFDEPAAWVRTVAVRLALNRFRKARNMLKAYVRHGAPEDAPALNPDAVALMAALRQLPEVQRHTVVLHHFLDLPVSEICAVTGAAEGTVKARLSRGRAGLARLLAPEQEPSPNSAGVRAARVETEASHV